MTPVGVPLDVLFHPSEHELLALERDAEPTQVEPGLLAVALEEAHHIVGDDLLVSEHRAHGQAPELGRRLFQEVQDGEAVLPPGEAHDERVERLE